MKVIPPLARTVFAETASLTVQIAKAFLLLNLCVALLLTVTHFPYDTDPPGGRSGAAVLAEAGVPPSGKSRPAGFYEAAYSSTGGVRGVDYEATAKAAAEHFRIKPMVEQFAAEHDLSGRRVLEVGSGRGYLQDVVSDYTGLDISPSVSNHYHKRFVVGSATEMPFQDNSFDAIWTVWVLEHIPEPEKALREMRRVLKPGGLLLLYVAWNCTSWARDGFSVRPYSDFNWRGKLVKGSLAVRSLPLFTIMHRLPARAIRSIQYGLGLGDRLHFRALEPNYEVYWEADSDAAVSLDSYEAYLWFRQRGDKCLNCMDGSKEGLLLERNPLIIRVNK